MLSKKINTGYRVVESIHVSDFHIVDVLCTGRTMIVGCSNGAIEEYDADSLKYLRRVKKTFDAMGAIAIDGRNIIIGCDGFAQILDIDQDKFTNKIQQKQSPNMILSHSNGLVVLCHNHDGIELWDKLSNKITKTISCKILNSIIELDDNTIAFPVHYGDIVTYDLRMDCFSNTLHSHECVVQQLLKYNNDQNVISIDYRGGMRLWDINSYKCVRCVNAKYNQRTLIDMGDEIISSGSATCVWDKCAFSRNQVVVEPNDMTIATRISYTSFVLGGGIRGEIKIFEKKKYFERQHDGEIKFLFLFHGEIKR